jgi:hypothetical protein
MDTKLRLVATARHGLGNVLRAAQKRLPLHYALSDVKSNDLTLASLLHMMPEQSDQLLLVYGLSMKWKPSHSNKSDGDKQNKIQAKPNRHAWELFAVEHNLMEEYFYLDRHQVKEHTGDQKVYFLSYPIIICSLWPVRRLELLMKKFWLSQRNVSKLLY